MTRRRSSSCCGYGASTARSLPWMSWAAGDFVAKLAMIAVLLYPFKLLVALFPAQQRVAG